MSNVDMNRVVRQSLDQLGGLYANTLLELNATRAALDALQIEHDKLRNEVEENLAKLKKEVTSDLETLKEEIKPAVPAPTQENSSVAPTKKA